MAIEETRKKIHFTAFEIRKGRPVDTSPAPTVTIAKGQFRFGASLIGELDLQGKFVKFAYDPVKKIVGFKIAKTEPSLEGMKTWKKCKPHETNGVWSVSIVKMMEQMDPGSSAKTYYKLPVQKYVEQSDMLSRGEIYYFVEIGVGDEPRKYKKEQEEVAPVEGLEKQLV